MNNRNQAVRLPKNSVHAREYSSAKKEMTLILSPRHRLVVYIVNALSLPRRSWREWRPSRAGREHKPRLHARYRYLSYIRNARTMRLKRLQEVRVMMCVFPFIQIGALFGVELSPRTKIVALDAFLAMLSLDFPTKRRRTMQDPRTSKDA